MTRAATEMERRVAAVLAARAGLVPNDGAIERHLGDARAAIRAMANADDGFLDCICGYFMTPRNRIPVVWNAFIDYASPESP